MVVTYGAPRLSGGGVDIHLVEEWFVRMLRDAILFSYLDESLERT